MCLWSRKIRFLINCWIVFGLISLGDLTAQQPEEPVRYRRWFAPQDQLYRWPFPPGLNMPMDRQLFERQIDQLEKSPEQSDSAENPILAKIVLQAQLDGRQLVNGRGSFELQRRSAETNSIPLEPLTFRVTSPKWNDDSEASLVCGSDGTTRLILPENQETNLVSFDWSLRSRNDSRGGISFEIAFPPCFSTELQLDLPATMIPVSSVGLVLQDEKPNSEPNNTEMKRWRILLGQHSQAVLTILTDETSQSAKKITAMRQAVSYTIAPHGMDVTVRINFEKADSRLSEILLDLESPLRVTEVRYGDQIVSWSRILTGDDVTKIRVDLSPFLKEEPRELSVRSLARIQEGKLWTLPRVRVTSPNVFWMETRCGINVIAPLQIRNLSCERAVQVTPRVSYDWADRAVFTFQYFQDDAQVSLDVAYHTPRVFVNSVTQIQWGSNEIRGNMALDCNLNEGERFTLDFPISENWTVDSVKSSDVAGEDNVLSWDVIEGDGESKTRTLSVQLKQPLQTYKTLALQLSGRFLNGTQNNFRLVEFSPLVPKLRKGESNAVAVQLNFAPYHLKSSAEPAMTPDVNVPASWGKLKGLVYPLDLKTQDVRFDLERQKLNYSAEITGNAIIKERELATVFKFRCVPVDSSVDRVYVHFSTSLSTPQTTWTWSGNSESFQPLQTRKLPPKEVEELLPPFGSRNILDDMLKGETWEIRLAALQTTPFELQAALPIPLADSVLIPLASMPLAASQKGEIYVVSARLSDYHVINSRLHSIPIAAAEGNQYQEIRAAFRYDPREELHRLLRSPLLLQRLTSEETPTPAWIWSLRLDSQYESEGIVKNNALFLLENKGKENLRITLPDGIGIADVSAVWLNDQRTTWHPDHEKDSKGNQFNIVVVTLPERERFVSIAMEYSFQDLPLTRQRKLRPRYPKADVPILFGSWTSWFPPEFDVSLRRSSEVAANSATDSSENGSFSVSKALNYFAANNLFDPFSMNSWNRLFTKTKRLQESESTAKIFFEQITAELSKSKPKTWGELLGNERLVINMLPKLTGALGKGTDARLLIDKNSLAFLGVIPTTPISETETVSSLQTGEEIFEQAGLVLLVSSRTRSDRVKEYTLSVTSLLMLSLNRQYRTEPIGRCVQYLSENIDLARNESGVLSPSNWVKETTLTATPWSLSSQIVRITALTANWNAFELPLESDNSLYIVHRQTFIAFQWLTFLLVVLVTSRKPLSSPVFLIFLMIIFEILARSAAPCHLGVPSGAFLGAAVSFCFGLIRSRTSASTARINRRIVSLAEKSKYLAENPVKSGSTHGHSDFTATSLWFMLFFFAPMIAAAQTAVQTTVLPAAKPITKHKEAYRVFFPIDQSRQIVGDTVWLPQELFQLLSQNTQPVRLLPQHRWSISKAEYQGSLVYNPVTQILEVGDDFKAVYQILLESENATVALPRLPLNQDRIYWDSKPIKPAWRTGKESALTFNIENEKPGTHILEIALSPRIEQQDEDETRRITFEIPRVPDTVLRLTVPSDAPPITVSDCFGAVTQNTNLSPTFIAEVGASEKLTFAWLNNPNRSDSLVSEVEQYFWLRAKPTQVELNALFRFRIEGGKIRHLNIQIDPRWSRSGQFHCNEQQLEQRLETSFDPQSLENGTAAPYRITRLDFKSPVSGTLTIHANFVLRDFNGIGNIRLPELRALQSRITKSMLAVSAEPLVTVDCPATGRGTGFEVGWHQTSNLFEDPFFGFAGSLAADTMNTTPNNSQRSSKEHPLAEYDLSKTEPSWTLSIRTKKTLPKLKLTQSIQFDYGDSSLLAAGEFQAETEVFQQSFTLDELVQIESVQVHDSRGNLIESRWVTSKNRGLPTPVILFFKRPLTGNYTVTVRGHFVTENDADTNYRPVPMLTFHDADVTEQTLSVFRTSAMIVELFMGGTDWAKSDIAPNVPDVFANSFLLGSWRFKTQTAAEKEIESVIKPSTSQTTPAEQKPPQFVLLPNRPKVRCDEIISLNRSTGDLWTVTYDILSSITGGELETVRFLWDDRCGAVQSIEPPTSWRMEQEAGHSVLVLLPKSPLFGDRRFRIKAALNTPGTAVSLPHIVSESEKVDQYESRTFVILPRQSSDKTIPWKLDFLETVDVQVAKQLEQATAATLDEKGGVKSDTAVVPDPNRIYLSAVDKDFNATINRTDSMTVASFYDALFLVRRNGTVFGIATIDVKNRGQDSFILQMPQNYEPIQMTCAGLTTKGTKLSGNRWKIDVWASDYPQRLHLSFRGILSRASRDSDEKPRPLTLSQLSREKIVTSFKLPVLEGVVIQETLWSVLFEDSKPGMLPMFSVSSVRERQMGPATFTSSELLGENVVELGEHIPLSGVAAWQSIIGIHLTRQYNLLRVLNTVSDAIPAKSEEMKRWYSHWADNWFSLADKVDVQMSHLSALQQNGKPQILLDPQKQKGEETQANSAAGFIGTWIESMNLSITRNALIVSGRQGITEKLGLTESETVRTPTLYPRLNSQVYWQNRVMEDAQYLFGVSEGTIQSIRLESQPEVGGWSLPQSKSFFLWLAIPVLFLILLRHVHLMDILLQFPHFWGVLVGILLWNLFPSLFLGFSIILLTFFSLFRPNWSRRGLPEQRK
ncbi:hypothetical protein FACS1894189_4070 [Planctomycetales bacterium]|nr:hypothetical protein FACS1894189_4070 [Planctomycetales bacterium]